MWAKHSDLQVPGYPAHQTPWWKGWSWNPLALWVPTCWYPISRSWPAGSQSVNQIFLHNHSASLTTPCSRPGIWTCTPGWCCAPCYDRFLALYRTSRSSNLPNHYHFQHLEPLQCIPLYSSKLSLLSWWKVSVTCLLTFPFLQTVFSRSGKCFSPLDPRTWNRKQHCFIYKVIYE